MKPVSLFIGLFFLLTSSTAQVSATVGGSLSYMVASPSLFTITDAPLGLGGLFKLNWVGSGGYRHRFVEIGYDSFKFQKLGSRRIVSWSYLRATFGGRTYTLSDKGFYVEAAGGFYGVIPSGFGGRTDKLHPGAGANFGFGYSGQFVCIGVNMHASLSSYGVGLVPVLHAGINLGN